VRYQRVKWRHAHAKEPVFLYAEIDDEGWEQRKVDEYRDGRLDRADHDGGSGTTLLADQRIADLAEINSHDEFEAEQISASEFDDVWRRAGR